MNYNILANLSRIIMNLISRKFKKCIWGRYSLFLQVMQIIFAGNVASYELFIIFFITLSNKDGETPLE